MIHTDEDDEFARIERENSMKGQPYNWEANAIKAAIRMEREACANTAGLALLGADKALSDRVLKAIRARVNVATNDTSQERVDKTSESVHEPVAWISATELLVMRGNALGGAKDWRVNLGLEPEEGDVGLYTTPPQRTWIPLTDEEKNKMAFIAGSDKHWLIRLVENKLKERNT